MDAREKRGTYQNYVRDVFSSGDYTKKKSS